MAVDFSSDFPEEAEAVSLALLLIKVLVIVFAVLFGTITFLLGKVRRKNRRFRYAAHALEQLLHTTRANLERAEQRLKEFREFGASFYRKNQERGGQEGVSGA